MNGPVSGWPTSLQFIKIHDQNAERLTNPPTRHTHIHVTSHTTPLLHTAPHVRLDKPRCGPNTSSGMEQNPNGEVCQPDHPPTPGCRFNMLLVQN